MHSYIDLILLQYCTEKRQVYNIKANHRLGKLPCLRARFQKSESGMQAPRRSTRVKKALTQPAPYLISLAMVATFSQIASKSELRDPSRIRLTEYIT